MKWFVQKRDREPRRPLRFDSARAAPAYGIAWFRREQWDRLREVSTDGESLEATYEEWKLNATQRFDELTDSGLTLQKVDIDVEALVAWCAERNLALDGEARSHYTAFKLRAERGEGEGSAMNEEKSDRPSGPTLDIGAYFAERAELWRDVGRRMGEQITRAAELGVRTIADGGTIYFFGNGGSAADAQHLCTELLERLMFDRQGFRAHALTTNTSLLTASANDRGFDDVFSRQVETLAKPGDLLVAISTSGKSPNVLRALQAGRQVGAARLGLSGKDGGSMPSLCDICLIVPTDDTQKIQEVHIAIGHYICATIERRLAK